MRCGPIACQLNGHTSRRDKGVAHGSGPLGRAGTGTSARCSIKGSVGACIVRAHGCKGIGNHFAAIGMCTVATGALTMSPTDPYDCAGANEGRDSGQNHCHHHTDRDVW
jgi:hypothetical protein